MRSTKIMLFGIALMILTLYIQEEPGIRLAGAEIIILLFGFVLTIIGLFIQDTDK